MTQQLPPNIKTLLEDIQHWMLNNDYECGPVGSDIWNRINRNLPIDQILSPIKVISTKEIANEKHTFRGESFTMKEWAEKLKVNYRSFKSLVRNRSLEYAVSFYRGEIKHEFWNRCDCCGKLISYEDFELGVATRRLICFEPEEYETLCEKHKRS